MVLVSGTVGWTFLSNHGHVLVQLAGFPDMTMRDVALRVGITERAVQLIVRDLAQEGYVQIERVGRRNHYRVAGDRSLRHPAEQRASVGDLVSLFVPAQPDQSPALPYDGGQHATRRSNDPPTTKKR